MPQDPFAPLFDDKVDSADPFAEILAKPSPMKGGPSGVAARDARAAGYQQGYGDKIVEAARSQIGKTKYVWGGCKPGQTDCSGFTQSVAKSQGFDLVRTAQEQFKTTKKVDKPEKGDLVFMKTPSRKHKPGTEITHVGIYDGEGNLIHNSSSKGGVVSVPLSSMQKYIRGYGRIGSIEQFESELKPEKKVVVKSGPIKTIDDFLSRMPEAQLATDQAFSKQYAKTQEARKARLLQSYSNPKSEAEFKSALTALKKEFQLDLPSAVPEGVQDLYEGNPARAFEGNGADMFARGFGKALLGAGSPETLSALRKAVGKDYDKVMSGAGQNLMLAIASGISPVNAPQSLATMAAGVLPTAAMSNYLVDQGPEDVVAGAIFGPLLGKMLTKLGAGPAGKLLKEVASASPEKAYAKLEQLDLIDESVFKAAQDIEQLGATFRKPTARVTDDGIVIGGKKPAPQPYAPGTVTDLKANLRPKAPSRTFMGKDGTVVEFTVETGSGSSPYGGSFKTVDVAVGEDKGLISARVYGNEAFVSNHYLDRALRGKGIGSQALNELLTELDRMGVKKVTSDQYVSDDASWNYEAMRKRGWSVRRKGVAPKSNTAPLVGADRVYTVTLGKTPKRAEAPKVDKTTAPKVASAPMEKGKVVEEPVAQKEPWQMTRDEFADSKGRKSRSGVVRSFDMGEHAALVENAYAGGKPVPPEVLADYPDLAAKYKASPVPEKNAGGLFKEELVSKIASESISKTETTGAKESSNIYERTSAALEARKNGDYGPASNVPYKEADDALMSVLHGVSYGTPDMRIVIDFTRAMKDVPYESGGNLRNLVQSSLRSRPGMDQSSGSLLEHLIGAVENGKISAQDAHDWLKASAKGDFGGIDLDRAADDILKTYSEAPSDLAAKYKASQAVKEPSQPLTTPETPTPKLTGEATKAVDASGEAKVPAKRDFQAEKEAIRAEIRKKRSVAGSGIDPTIIGDYLKLAKVYVEEGIDSIANLVKSLKDDGASDNEADLAARVAMGEPLTKVDKRNLAKFGLLRGIAATRPVAHPGLNSASLVDKIQRLNSMTTDAVKRSGGLDANEMTQAHILMNDLIRRIPKMSEDEAKSAIEQLVGLSTAVERSGSSRGFLLQQLQQRARQRGNKRLYEDFIQRVSKQDLTKEQRGAVEAIVGDIQKSSDKLNKATVDAALKNKELDRAVKEAGFTRYSDAEVAAAKKRLQQALAQAVTGIFSMGAGGGYVDFGAVTRDLKIVLSPVFGKVKSFSDLFNEARSYIPEDKMSDVELTDALIHIVASERRMARMSNAWGDDYLQVGNDMIKDSSIPEWKKSVEDLFTEAEKLFDVDEDAGLSLYELFAKKVADAEKLPEGKERRLALGKIKRWLDAGKVWEEDLAMKGFLGSDDGFFSGKGFGLADNVVKQARKELDDAIKASDLFLISQLDSTWGEKIARWTENNRTIDPLNRVVDFLSGSWNVLDVPARVLARIPDAVMSKLGFTPSMASLPKADILRIVGDMRRLRVRAEIKGGGALREGAKEVYKSPLFKKWDKFMGEYVALPDAVWRAMVRPYAELEAAIVLAKREVADGVLDQGAIKARAEQIIAENSREYTDSVAWIMDEANFSQDSLFSKLKQGALRTVKKSLPEALEPPVTTFVNLFFGFTRVFSNIARLNLEYTGGGLMPAVYIAQIGAKLGVDILGNKKSLNAALKAIPDRDVRRLSIAIGRGVYGAYVFSAIGDMLYDNGGLAPKTFDPGRGIIDYGFWDQMPGPFKVIVERNRQRFLEDRLKDKTITKAQYEKLLGPPDEDALKQIEALDKKRKMGEITMQQYIDKIKGIEITPQAGLGAPPGSTLSWSSMARVALSQPIFTNMAKIDPNSADAFADYIAQQSMSLLPMSGGSGVQRIKDQGVPFVWDGEGVYSREGDGIGRVAKRIPGLADNYLPKGNPYALNGVKGSDPVVKELMYLNAMPRIVLKEQDKGYRTTESKESAQKRLKPILAREFSQIKRRMAMPDWKTKTPLQKKNIIQSIRDRNRQRIEKIFRETGVRLDMLVSDGE